jgi:hypothetical protein
LGIFSKFKIKDEMWKMYLLFLFYSSKVQLIKPYSTYWLSRFRNMFAELRFIVSKKISKTITRLQYRELKFFFLKLLLKKTSLEPMVYFWPKCVVRKATPWKLASNLFVDWECPLKVNWIVSNLIIEKVCFRVDSLCLIIKIGRLEKNCFQPNYWKVRLT